MSQHTPRRRPTLLLSIVPVLAVAAWPVTAARAATTPSVWSTYHADNTRGGEDTADGAFGSVSPAWATGLDGAIFAQPLLDGNTVIVATENDSVYGIDATYGSVLWRTNVGTPVTSGLPCGNINPLGITSTPVLDTASNTVYALAERVPSGGGGAEHVLVAVDAGSGALLSTRNVDPAGMTPIDQQQRGALMISNGMVYVPFGGLWGDCGTYWGWVVGVAENLGGNLAVFQTPDTRSGIWAPAGVSGDGAGNVYAVTGNASSTSSCAGGNTVFKLSPSLQQVGSFADPNCVNDNASDTDLGSAGTLLLPDGSLFVLGKQNTAYVVSQSNMALRSSLGGVCTSIGADAYSNGRIYTSCVSGGGVAALDYTSSSGALSLAWHGPSDANGPPIVAGGYVWVTAYNNGKLYALNPANGAVAMQFSVPSMHHFTSPTAGGGRILLGADSQVLAFNGQNPVIGGPPPTQGYWTAATDGGVFAYGNAHFFGSTGNIHLNQPIVGMAATPGGGGYWMVASDGGVFAFGNAHFFGSTGNIRLNQPVVGMASTPDGGGYWLVARDGGVFSFGDAAFFGSTGNIHLNQPIVGMAAAAGGGYWLVAADGGIFSFGPGAGFHGSTGNIRLNQPVVGMAATPDGGGYWMVASDGGIFAFGTAQFFGSTGALHLNAPVVGIAPTAGGRGYRLTATDGGIFCFGEASYYGSHGGLPLNAPMVAIAATG
jgi:outer membrane protein assembly factor BamB